MKGARQSRMDCPAKPCWPAWIHTGLLVSICALVWYINPILVESAISKLDAPHTAMVGMARADAGMHNGMVFLTFSFLLFGVAVGYLTRRRLRPLAAIPLLALLPLYYSCRDTADRIESTPAFVVNYTASQTDISTFAEAVKAGRRPAVPAQVGRFQIIRYELLSTGAVVLVTYEDQKWHSKMWGFVWYPNQPFTEEWASSIGLEGEAGTENRVKQIMPSCYVLYNNYIYVKRGWS